MRIKMIKCDICKKEIEGNPYKFSVCQEDRESVGTLLDLEGEVLDRSVELYDYDYCPNCIRRMMRRLMGKPAIIDPEFDQAVDDMIRGSKDEKTEGPEREDADDILNQIQELREQIQEKIEDDEAEPEQKEGKTVLQYFEEAKARMQQEEKKETFTERLEREEAEKQDSTAKKTSRA